MTVSRGAADEWGVPLLVRRIGSEAVAPALRRASETSIVLQGC